MAGLATSQAASATGTRSGGRAIIPSLSYNVDPRCNMKCVYCPPYYENLQDARQRAPREVILAFVEAAARAGLTVLRLSGGEPLLAPTHVTEVARAFKAAEANGAREVRLNTNGYFLGRHAEALKAAGVDVLKISVDTLDRARFREITRVDGLNQVIDGIRIAKSLEMRIELNMVLVDQTVNDIWPLVDFCVQNQLEGLKVLDCVEYDDPAYWRRAYVEPSGLLAALTSRFGPPTEDRLSSGRGVRMLEFRSGAGPRILVKDCRQGTTYSETFCSGCPHYPCQEGFYNLTLNSDGKLKPCRIRVDRYHDLAALWNAEAAAGRQAGEVFEDLVRKLLSEYYRPTFFAQEWRPNR